MSTLDSTVACPIAGKDRPLPNNLLSVMHYTPEFGSFSSDSVCMCVRNQVDRRLD